MIGCTYMHDKMIYEERKLQELCPEGAKKADFILSGRGKELCGYCLEECPDRFECNKYSADAK